MTVDLTDVAKTILERAQQIGSKDKTALKTVVDKGNMLIEVLSFLLKSKTPENFSLLDPVLDEVFIDFHISITLGMAQEFKAACVLLRTCVETSLYLLYFVDHPVEARLWANANKDMGFKDTLAQVATAEYLKAANDSTSAHQIDASACKNQLANAYRALSERVHGKYAFLQSTGRVEDRLAGFSELSNQTIRSLVLLSIARCPDYKQVLNAIPALQRV